MKMSTQSRSTTYAVLGLLSVRSWTTYELAKQVTRSLNWFWPRAERKLYDEPKRLVTAGLATATEQWTGRRRSTVYEITETGRAELGAWLGEPSAPRSQESEAVLKLFFADAGTLDQLRDILAGMADEARERLGRLAAMAAEPQEYAHRAHLSALLLRLYTSQEAEVVRWSEWAQTQVDQWASAADAGEWDAAGVLADLVRRAGEVEGATGDRPAR